MASGEGIRSFIHKHSLSNSYKSNNICTIMYNGDLVDYHVNEFMDCG